MKWISDTGDIWIGQKAYTEAVLRKFGMENSKSASIPVTPGIKLIKATEQSDTVDIYTVSVSSRKLIIFVWMDKTRYSLCRQKCGKILFKAHNGALGCCETYF